MAASRLINSARTSFALGFKTSSRMPPLQPLLPWLPTVAALHPIVRRFFDPGGGWGGQGSLIPSVVLPSLQGSCGSIASSGTPSPLLHRRERPCTGCWCCGVGPLLIFGFRSSGLWYRAAVVSSRISNPGTKALLSQFPNWDLRHPVNSSITMLGPKPQLSRVFGRL